MRNVSLAFGFAPDVARNHIPNGDCIHGTDKNISLKPCNFIYWTENFSFQWNMEGNLPAQEVWSSSPLGFTVSVDRWGEVLYADAKNFAGARQKIIKYDARWVHGDDAYYGFCALQEATLREWYEERMLYCAKHDVGSYIEQGRETHTFLGKHKKSFAERTTWF
jgi:hypothetical protein